MQGAVTKLHNELLIQYGKIANLDKKEEKANFAVMKRVRSTCI
jgi:hypothetical protein